MFNDFLLGFAFWRNDSEGEGVIVGEDENNNLIYKPSLEKITPDDIVSMSLSNCYAYVLGLIGYVEDTEDLVKIFSDDFIVVDDPKIGDIAFSYESEHAMIVADKKNGKLVYRSLWLDWGEVIEGTFDQLWERQFSDKSPNLKESGFKYLRKK